MEDQVVVETGTTELQEVRDVIRGDVVPELDRHVALISGDDGAGVWHGRKTITEFRDAATSPSSLIHRDSARHATAGSGLGRLGVRRDSLVRAPLAKRARWRWDQLGGVDQGRIGRPTRGDVLQVNLGNR